MSGRLDQDLDRVVVGAAADEPHGARAAEDGEGLAGPALLPTESLAGGEVGGVQLTGPAQLQEVRGAGRGEAGVP